VAKAPIDTRRTKPANGTKRGDNRKQMTLVITDKQFNKTNTFAKKAKLSFAQAVRDAIDKVYVNA
jgi:hypothetical protein